MTELGDRPGTWTGDFALYPKSLVGAGSLTNSSTVVTGVVGPVKVTFYNKTLPDPKIIVTKINPSGDNGDEFMINVSNTTNSALHTYGLKHTESDMDFVPAETYNVVEEDPTTVGNGYHQPRYLAFTDGTQTCPSATNAVSSLTDQPLVAGQTWFVCVYNTPAAPPTWSKTAANPSYDNGAAQWLITITNPSDGLARTVRVMEDDTVPALPDQGCAAIGGGFECNLAANEQVQLLVTRTVGQFCQRGSAANSATAAVYRTSTKVFDLPDQGPITATIPRDVELCGKPLISKLGSAFNVNDHVATWTITIDNNVGESTERTVVISDSDDLVGNPPAGCSGDLPGSLTCTIPANGSVVLTVERAVSEACAGFTVTDSATAKINGQHIQGSPTDDIPVAIPANARSCPRTPTATPTQSETPTFTATPTSTATPEGTETTVTQEPSETPETDTDPVVESTPVAPGTGSGIRSSSGSVKFLFIGLALLFFSSSLGALSLASQKGD